MTTRPRSLTIAAATYGLGELLLRGVELLLVPLYARFLHPAQYGIVELARPFTAVWQTVCQGGLQEATLRQVFTYSNPADRRRFLGTITAGVLGLVLGLTGLAMLVGPTVLSPWLHDIPFFPYVALALSAGALLALPAILLTVLQAGHRASAYVALQGLQGLLLLALVAYMVAIRRAGAAGQLLGVVLVGTVMTTVAAVWLRHDLARHFDWPLLRGAVAYGLPLTGHVLLWLVMRYGDRLILQAFLPLEDVAVYALGFNLAFSLAILMNAYNRAWLPRLFHQSTAGTLPSEAVAQVTTHLTAVMLLGALTLSVFAAEAVGLLATERYRGAIRVIPIIAFAQVFTGLYQMAINTVWLQQKTLYSTLTTGIAAVATIALDLLLVPRFGIMGAAYGWLGSSALFWAAAHRIAVRFYPLRYEWRRLMLLAALALAAYQLGVTVQPGALPLRVLWKVGMCLPLGIVTLRLTQGLGRAATVTGGPLRNLG